MSLRITPTTLLVGAGAALGLYWLFSRPRTAGDLARVGDEVLVPVTSVPRGSLPPALPQGAGLLGVRVDRIDTGTATEPIVSYVLSTLPNLQRVGLPVPFGPVAVSRAWITNVLRNGREVT